MENKHEIWFPHYNNTESLLYGWHNTKIFKEITLWAERVYFWNHLKKKTVKITRKIMRNFNETSRILRLLCGISRKKWIKVLRCTVEYAIIHSTQFRNVSHNLHKTHRPKTFPKTLTFYVLHFSRCKVYRSSRTIQNVPSAI